MSHFFTLSALSLVSFVSVAAVASTSAGATTSHRSLEETVALLPQRQRPVDFVSDARQLFITGQIIPAGFGQPVGYAQLNSALRAEYHLDAEPDYIFARGYLYAVDHRTKTIKRVIPVTLAR